MHQTKNEQFNKLLLPFLFQPFKKGRLNIHDTFHGPILNIDIYDSSFYQYLLLLKSTTKQLVNNLDFISFH